MSLWLDEKYVNLSSPRLSLFKKKGPYLWNFRCVFCGDSKKDKTKTRGYIYKKKSDLFYHCHNCHESMFFGKFLQRIDPTLHREYSLEKFRESSAPTQPVEDFAVDMRAKFNEVKMPKLPSLLELPFNHKAKQACLKRKIPEEKFGDIFYTDCFRTTVEEIRPGYAEEKKFIYAEPRLIMPFYDEEKNFCGVQGRALSESKAKYITILVSETSKKVYGLDRVKLDQKIHVFEGPFDSMFVPNSVAAMDSALFRVSDIMGVEHDYTFVYDNEKRNSQILSNMEKTIKQGKNVFIWPRSIVQKDINDLVKEKNYTSNELLALLSKNTFNGMQASIRLAAWRI